jgi:hypothetical protein
MEGIRTADGIYGRGLETIRGKRSVVAIDDDDEVLTKKRLHCGCLNGVCAYGDETLPQISARESVGTGRVDDGVGHFNGVDDFWRLNACRGKCGRMGYDGYGVSQRGASLMNCDRWKQIRGQQVNH